MISERAVAKETKRLFGLPFPPSTDDGKAGIQLEWYLAMQGVVETTEHLKAVIDWCMLHLQRCPTPAQVSEAAGQIKAPDKAKAPLGCAACQGSGYVSFTKRVHIAGMDPYDADFSRPCDCALGQFIQPEYDKRRNRAQGAAQDLG